MDEQKKIKFDDYFQTLQLLNESTDDYLFLCDSIENPIWICQNVEEFFSLLQKNSQTSI